MLVNSTPTKSRPARQLPILHVSVVRCYFQIGTQWCAVDQKVLSRSMLTFPYRLRVLRGPVGRCCKPSAPSRCPGSTPPTLFLPPQTLPSPGPSPSRSVYPPTPAT